MKKRSKAGGEPIKGQRRKAPEPKRRIAPKGQALSNFSPAIEETELARLTRELTDERRQRVATSEVLRLLSASRGDLNHLFDTILTNATNLCQANFGTLSLREGEAFRIVATHNVPPGLAELRRREPLVRAGPLLRMAEIKRLLHIADYMEYVASHPADTDAAAFARLTGVRTTLEVPMLKADDVIGAIVIYRTEVRRFDDREIELVKDFAAQAVIAIENARLLNELRQSLEQQTATSEVLKVISRSQFDLQLVLDNLIQTATSLCGAKRGVIFRRDGDLYRAAAFHNATPELIEFVKNHPIAPGRHTVTARVALERRVIHVADLQEDKEYTYALRDTESIRTEVGVPMFRGDHLVGVFILYKVKVEPFTDKEIELVTTFADQAVIAIENARLLNELRQRTDDLSQRTTDLTEALEQQTATSDVLEVISRSAFDLQAVFETVAESSVRLCGADRAFIFRFDGELLRMVVGYNSTPGFVKWVAENPIRPGRHSGSARAALERRTIHIADVLADPEYIYGAKDVEPIRTVLGVPILKGDDLLGVMMIYRLEVRPFTDRQIALVETFADQAAIAIENVRLLDELREALQQQTATADVLKVISRSKFDLQTVLNTLLASAAQLCQANHSFIFLREDDAYHLAVGSGEIPEWIEYLKEQTIKPGRGTVAARAVLEGRTIHIPDVLSDPEYTFLEAQKRGGFRTVLGVPLLRDGVSIGVMVLTRPTVQPFDANHIALVTTFADQALIAIENVNLLDALRERTEDVETLNQQLEQRVIDQVGEIERMSRLRRFLPPQVADLIVASGTEKQLESHRREITALFCDLRGFTGFTESADAEDVMALLRDYHAAIGEIIIKYNGTLERYAGDGVMVVFNDPVPVENPALQAVLMALEVRDALGALTATWSRLGHEIGFGIGIAHGFATLGTIGFEGRFDYAAIGTVSNVASRLCDEAKPGQILISPRVLMNVENAVQVEPVGEFELKGIRRPLAAYNVVGAQSSGI